METTQEILDKTNKEIQEQNLTHIKEFISRTADKYFKHQPLNKYTRLKNEKLSGN